jgi:hypothetical protein
MDLPLLILPARSRPSCIKVYLAAKGQALSQGMPRSEPGFVSGEN